VNAGEQPTDSVAHAGRFAGEVVVETDEDAELGECVITGIDPSQRVGMVLAVSAMMNASRASVLACPGYRSAIRRIDRPGSYATWWPQEGATVTGRAPIRSPSGACQGVSSSVVRAATSTESTALGSAGWFVRCSRRPVPRRPLRECGRVPWRWSFLSRALVVSMWCGCLSGGGGRCPRVVVCCRGVGLRCCLRVRGPV